MTNRAPSGTEMAAGDRLAEAPSVWKTALNVMLIVALVVLVAGGLIVQAFETDLLDSALLAQRSLANAVATELQPGEATNPTHLRTARDMSMGAGNRLYLLDATGLPVLGPTDAGAQALVRNPAFQRVRQSIESMSVVGQDDARQPVLISYRSIPGTDLTLVLVASRETALLPAKQLHWLLLAAFPPTYLAVLLIIWLAARRLLWSAECKVRRLQSSNAALTHQRRQLTVQADRDCRFFQEASHDFRQRLHAMQLLLHTMQQSDQREGRQLLAKSQYVVRNLLTYVKDFLELARLKVDKQSPQCQPLEVQRLFQELELGFEDVALERELDLCFRASALQVSSDEKLLLRILENLLANACKFARSRVLVAARRHKGGMALEVWDNGPGISEQDRQRIFDAYYQASRGCPSGDEGVGLGLAIVMRLCVVLGHEVSVHARHGLTFIRVLIPGNEATQRKNREVLPMPRALPGC